MRVLFAGNSYTMYNDVPAQVAAIARDGGAALATEMVAEGGASWRIHLESLGTPARIRASRPDVVVMQNRSTEALLEPGDFQRCGDRLVAEARDAGARVVLYQTWAWHRDNAAYRDRWARRDPRGWLDAVIAEYGALADRHGLAVARVGEAWAMAIEAHPEIRLHDTDDHHALPTGSFLAACVLTSTITGVDVAGTSFHPEAVPAEQAAALRAVAAGLG